MDFSDLPIKFIRVKGCQQHKFVFTEYSLRAWLWDCCDRDHLWVDRVKGDFVLHQSEPGLSYFLLACFHQTLIEAKQLKSARRREEHVLLNILFHILCTKKN